ncbi:glycerol-3-phosphate dehydrogenase/oxidase [Ramlibacter sp. H39-3-26]|uniref:glycerol-3-phosphate dehydrogenase/oxidase n=1 Tax=Curvibacter soli TaxID=3031331 RepID=UPI0023DA8814|nr:glycerol-3-phosphate dehydrogenase/oxidase [Ramlibacter sp. H39-3-26]MDF1484971.1 glycerol-3-phosphate dehydrogenase/oxidase [Ramlibacter sp. H39-3-26]
MRCASSIPSPLPTDRAALLERLAAPQQYDLAVIGGGATGLGVALDAAARGFSVVLVEALDFAKGTSSRATKLAHGGVRYLAQGNIALVREALHERTNMLRNAPHLAQPLPFVMPAYHCWETPFYGAGLKMYDLLAGKAGLGATEFLGRAGALRHLPTLRPDGLKGGVRYWDGQFDDARLALALARTAASRGALLVNYCAARTLAYEGGKVAGLVCADAETGWEFTLRARAVVNATGVWVDALREQDGAQAGRSVRPIVAPSQGVHLVVDREFLPCDHALLVPKTSDGRVLFAVPWLGKVVLGTTDTPRHDLAREPAPFPEEVAFVLGEAGRYLRRAPQAADVRSSWVGLRPLVRPAEDAGAQTRKISREHTVLVSPTGLVTVTGGKWTTYRAMAEDVLDHCFGGGLLDARPGGVTADLPLVGAQAPVRHRISDAPGPHLYGAEQAFVQQLPGAGHMLGAGLTEAMVRFAARHEYARTVEDVLARRWRLLFLDARLAAELAPAAAALLWQETGADPGLAAFLELANRYATLPLQHSA